MKAELTTRPTEYRGIQYRSKCEAMFARYLDLDHQEQKEIWNFQQKRSSFRKIPEICLGFYYEPAGVSVNKWVPDFVTFEVTQHETRTSGMPEIVYSVIEYKPSKPTTTYIAEWCIRCRSLFTEWHAKELHQLWSRTTWQLFYGSVYTNDRSVIDTSVLNDWTPEDQRHDWLINYEDAIRETRFDLESEA